MLVAAVAHSLEQLGVGRFHYILLLLCGWANASDAVELMAVCSQKKEGKTKKERKKERKNKKRRKKKKKTKKIRKNKKCTTNRTINQPHKTWA